jgi:hypothetical protein
MAIGSLSVSSNLARGEECHRQVVTETLLTRNDGIRPDNSHCRYNAEGGNTWQHTLTTMNGWGRE